MNYRILGRTGLSVSEVGFGAWGLGHDEWRGGDDREGATALRSAYDLGINFYDTALAYGQGHSESLIAAFAKDVGRTKVHIATKIPPKNKRWPAECGTPAQDAFPPEYIRNAAHQSLKNLKTDYIDLLQLHVWQDPWLEQTDWQDELLKLKQEGKIRFIGVSINDHDPNSALLLAQHSIADSIQCIYNIFDPTAEDALIDLCHMNQIGVIARVPFDEGALTGEITSKTVFPEGDFRRLYFEGDRLSEVEARVGDLKSLLGDEARTLPELALRFCLSHPLISTVIPGMRKTAHVQANTKVSDGRALSRGILDKLKAFAWSKNFYASLHA